MNDMEAKQSEDNLIMEYEIDAPPEKVWRAISIPEFREKWFPEKDLADTAPISAEPGQEVCYRMREEEEPFLESIVTFQVGPNVRGGTRLRIIHHLADARTVQRTPRAANNNLSAFMLAA
ncbi:SRPBCC domain-containing protein [Ochrobactrum anthropi]|uniref:SRPBCC family protein n=1 Tax=Brucella anthropi TaxID=529 RepID=UPI00195099B2|nr:SRPBCC domain-containing protein [Brucella anthropi]MBM6398618.1 SRPBCC domain-containing protein [Brucella anthropi]